MKLTELLTRAQFSGRIKELNIPEEPPEEPGVLEAHEALVRTEPAEQKRRDAERRCAGAERHQMYIFSK